MTGTPFGGFVSGLFQGIESRHGWDDRKRRQKLEDEDYEFRRKERVWAAEDQAWQQEDRAYTRSERERTRGEREEEKRLAEEALAAAKAAQAGGRSIDPAAPAAPAPGGVTAPDLQFGGAAGAAPLDSGIMRTGAAPGLGYAGESADAQAAAMGAVNSPFITPGQPITQAQLGYGEAIPAGRDLSSGILRPDVAVASPPPFVPDNHISKAELDPQIQELDGRLAEIYAQEDEILKSGGMVNAGFAYQKKALQDERIARMAELQQAAGGEFNRDPIRQPGPAIAPGRAPALGYGRSIEEPQAAGPDAPVQTAAPTSGVAALTSSGDPAMDAAAAATGQAPASAAPSTQIAGREIGAPSVGAPTGETRSQTAKRGKEPVDDFMDAYMTEGVPLLVEGYLKMGQFNKAMEFQKFATDHKAQKTMRIWAEAVRAASIGDAEGALDKMTEYHSKIDDGITVVREKSDYIRDDKGNITGINLTMRDDETGREFSQQYSGVNDFMDEFIAAGAPEKLFEYLTEQAKAGQDAEKDALKHERSIELARIKGAGGGVSREDAIDFLSDNDHTFFQKTPAEQEAAIDAYMLMVEGGTAPSAAPPPVYR